MSQTTRRLFGAKDLEDFIQSTVDPRAAAMAERVVWGWLKPVLKRTERPAADDAQADEIFAWALQLGAIVLENPSGLSAYQLGDENSQYSSEARDRVLAEAASGGAVAGDAPPSPLGTFPPPSTWPDPIRVGPRPRCRW